MIERRKLRRRRLVQAGAGLGLAPLLAVLLAPVVGPEPALGFALVICAMTLWFASRHVGVPVLVYHAVSDDTDWLPWADNIAVRPQVFARHMQVLARSRWTVVPSQALIDAQRGVSLPRKSVVLHFDDAYRDFRTDALPVLTRHGFAATVFASSDFIDPEPGLRGPGRGYMNADELREVDAHPLIEVACHGKDHARVSSGPGKNPRAPDVWCKQTAWLWSLQPGNKARWFETAPPAERTVPQNDSSLCAQIWTPDGKETPAARNARVITALKEARRTLCDVLGRDVTFLCWPFDRCDAQAVTNARAAGFTAFTGGVTDNIPANGEALISRTHVNDSAAGGGPVWIEALVFRAKLEVAAGNLLWLPVTAIAATLRRRRFAFLHGPQAATQTGTA